VIRKIQRADGVRFQVYGRKNGKQVYVTTCDSKKEAAAAERRFAVEQEMVASGELAPEHDAKLTLAEGAEAWLKMLSDAGARGHTAYSEFMRYQILPLLGSVPIAKLTRAQITAWRDTACKKYAASTINSAIGALSSAFTWFVEEKRWLDANPCRGVAQAEVPERAYNWIKTRGELERLLLTCADDLRDMIAVSVGTAIRIDEMLHLQWDDVDLENRLITIQRGRKGPPKGGRIRHVPILDSVLHVFKARALRRSGGVLVFPGKEGRVRAQSPVTQAYKAALKRAQMDTSLRWHDLRHTAASWWVMSGGDIFRLSKLMGHRKVEITQRTYAHLAPEAWQMDYGRIAFHVPSEPAKVVEFVRNAEGKLAGRRSVMVDARAAG